MFRRLIVLGFLVTVTLLAQGCRADSRINDSQSASQPAAVATTATAPETPLKALQSVFRPTYDTARDNINLSLSPIVVVRFSDLFLVKDGEVIAEGKGIPQKYHLLHRTAHVPFVIYLKLHPHFNKPLPAECAKDIAAYRSLIDKAIPDLGNYGFTASEIEWQQSILTDSEMFLRPIKDQTVITEAEFARFQSQTHRWMMAAADAAGAAQVDATHSVMKEWKTKLSAEEWDRLRVIIVGVRQPRHDYAATQYFSALFPSEGNSLFPGENRRVFYIESLEIKREDKAFKNERRAVSTLLLDAAASDMMFNNSYRMSIDVMADGAKRRVGELDFAEIR